MPLRSQVPRNTPEDTSVKMPCFFLSKNSPPNQLNKKTQNKYDFKYFFQHVIYYYIIYFKTLQSFINFTSQNPMHIFRSKLAAALPVNTTLRLTTASQALRIRSCTFSLNKKRGRAMKTLFHARASRYCLPEKLQPCIIPQELRLSHLKRILLFLLEYILPLLKHPCCSHLRAETVS